MLFRDKLMVLRLKSGETIVVGTTNGLVDPVAKDDRDQIIKSDAVEVVTWARTFNLHDSRDVAALKAALGITAARDGGRGDESCHDPK